MALLRNKQIREIDYLSRDFDTIKTDLIGFLKRNFINDWNDFNEASGGMALLELLAYIGDQMSFYTDRQVNEGFIWRAVEDKNVLAAAQSLGYEPDLATPAQVLLSVSSTMQASTSANTLFKLKKGSRVITNFDPVVSFEIIEDVDFSSTANRQVTTNGTEVQISVSSVTAVAGQSRTFSYTVGEPTSFMKVTLPDEDIIEVYSISGSDNSEWFEVDFLAQDTIFIGEQNTTSSSGTEAYVLKLQRVPKRYVVERETNGRTSVRFGSGILANLEDSEVIPNPEDFVLPPTLRGSPSGFLPAIVDSTNFLKTKTMGDAPRNISLDISYRYGGGLDTNVGPRTLTKFRDVKTEFLTNNLTTVSADVTNNIIGNLTVTNYNQASGGGERESLEEIRENAAAYFASQGRAVTLQDYQVFVMSMPQKFGSVFRSIARKDPSNNLGVELVVIGRDQAGRLASASNVLKNNIETYIKQYRSFFDSIKISDGRIVNIGINFAIVPARGYNDNEALLATFFLLRNEFDVSNTNFNAQIIIPEITSKIQSLKEVLSVAEFSIFNRVGTIDGRTYSGVECNIAAHKINGIITFESDQIYEVKYVDNDIIGRTV